MSDADRYFAMGATERGEPSGEGRYVEVDADIPAVEFVPGLAFRPVVGWGLMANFVRFAPNTVAPVHTHDEEQITIVLEGELEFDLDGDVRVMRPGMAAVIPPGIPHGARTRDTTCFEIDVFHPPRRALLDLLQDQGQEGS